MLVAPSTTWLFVMTSPVEVSTIPVPAPSGWACELPEELPKVVGSKNVLMLTTPGSTRSAMAWRSSVPDDGPVCGDAAIGRSGAACCVVEVVGELPGRNRPQPIPTPAL